MPRLVFVMSLILVLSACGRLEVPASREIWGSPEAVRARARSDRSFVMARAVRVGKGDTVYALSRRHGVSPRGIIEANNLKPPYYLKVGQRIVLPRPNIHVVRSGETLYGISRAYGTDTFTIARTNRLKKPYRLHAGDRLTIPTGGRNRVSKASTVKTVAAKPADKSAAAERRPKPVVRVPRPPARSGKFAWPVEGEIISTFGAKKGGYHNDGINIGAPRGTPVLAAENGVVVYAGNELRGFGKLLLIKHADNYVTAYAHNEALLARKGDRVRKGARIARVGSTGSVTTPQLHFEVREGKRARDPRQVLVNRRR